MQTVEEILLHAHDLGIREYVIKKMKSLNESEFDSANKLAESAYFLTLKELNMENVDLQICDWNSSLIKKTEYSPVENKLIIQFSNDKRYEYENFSKEEYDDFFTSESKGKYFLTKIKKDYADKFKKLEEQL